MPCAKIQMFLTYQTIFKLIYMFFASGSPVKRLFKILSFLAYLSDKNMFLVLGYIKTIIV